MAARSLIVLITLFLAASPGCNRKPRNVAVVPESEENTEPEAEASVDAESKLGNYEAMLEKTRKDNKRYQAILTLSEQIRRFQLEIGRSPTNLVELVQKRYLEKLPTPEEGTRFEYHWERGSISQIPINAPMRRGPMGPGIKNTLLSKPNDERGF